MDHILTIPSDLPVHHPFRLTVMMGLTALLYLTVLERLGSVVGTIFGHGG